MNKAFVREPDDDGRAFCPRCGSLGNPVTSGPLDSHIIVSVRHKIGDTGWFCGYPPCEVAYFDRFDSVVLASELIQPVYPKDDTASLCACFGFTLEEIEDDAADPIPVRIRALLARTLSADAHCQTLAADGRCCMAEIKRIYMKLRERR